MPRLADRLRRLAPLALLLVALAFVVGDFSRRRDDILRLTALGATDSTGVSVQPYGDTRALALPLGSMDAHWWLLHAEQLAADDRPVRHTNRDDPPTGREVHWSSSISLGLVGLASLLRPGADTPLPIALASASLWLGPALLALVLATLGIVTWRRLGFAASALLLAALAASPGFIALFAPGEADHHGLAVSALLLCVWLLVLARGERRFFASSGVAGGAALWVSAATAIPVLVSIALGALLAARLRRNTSAPVASTKPSPDRWETWGRWGAATSLVFYALEYLPAHAGWRLEVNHPLHALAWWAGAVWLGRLADRIEFAGPLFISPRDRLLAAAQALAIAAPPLLVFFGGETFFVLRDPLLRTLHADYIHEFQPLATALPEAGWLAFPLLWLAPLPAGWLLLRTRREPHPAAIAPLALLVVFASAGLALTCWQIRWQSLATVGCALLAVLVWRERSAFSRRARVVFAAFLAIACLQFPLLSRLIPAPARPDRSELASLVVRDLAWALREVADPARAIVLSGPTTSTQLAWFGGWRVLGTLYWENLDGLRAAAAIFGAPDTDAALRLCRARGVTHLVLFSWDDFASAYARLHRLETGDAHPAPTPDSLAALLAAGRIPVWLRPLAYDIPPALGLADQRAVIYEVHPDQTSVEAALHLARYQREIGDPAAARRSLVRASELIANGAAATPELRAALAEESAALDPAAPRP